MEILCGRGHGTANHLDLIAARGKAEAIFLKAPSLIAAAVSIDD